MTMRTLKQFAVIALVALVAVFLAAPSAIAKKQLAEDELDLVTAAGQPKIVQTAGSNGTIDFTDTTEAILSLGDGVQDSLNALTLNNVAGENQLATGTNIQGATNNAEGTQDVTITQSWGSIKDITVVSTSAPGGTGCAAGAEKCFNNKGGNASSSQMMLSKMADVIIESAGEGSPVTVLQDPQFDLILGVDAQANLSALVVNNVVGLNQVASGVNIQGTGINFLPLTLSGAGGSSLGGQAIEITQCRGTPCSRPLFSTSSP